MRNIAYPLKNDYLAFMGRYSSLVGATAFAMMFLGAQINQFLGWRKAALTTPGNYEVTK
jgi:ATP/ADP translocase